MSSMSHEGEVSITCEVALSWFTVQSERGGFM